MRQLGAIAATFALGLLGAGVVCGQDYPNRPIRFITSGIGGGGDFAARHIGQGISGALGQQIIVDNRGGGVNPMAAAVKVDPDGS